LLKAAHPSGPGDGRTQEGRCRPALSAGALVYVRATHLLPQAETEHKKYRLFALGTGILLAVVIIFSKG